MSDDYGTYFEHRKLVEDQFGILRGQLILVLAQLFQCVSREPPTTFPTHAGIEVLEKVVG